VDVLTQGWRDSWRSGSRLLEWRQGRKKRRRRRREQ
jgi:hypothetical protein